MCIVRRRSLAAVALLLSLAANALAGIAPAGRLGEAPLRHESQDRSGWRPSLKAAKTREQVVQLYNTVYLPGQSVSLGWTGSFAGCVPGTTNLAHQQAVIDRINYFRSLTDLPPVSLLAGTPVTQAQASALIMSANNNLSHTPPPSWTCYSADGASGAGSSNLALGAYGVEAINLYVDDPGGGNSAAGHRRWILFPPRSGMATGDVPGDPSHWPANTLYVFGPTTTRPATPNGVAWPPSGFVPYQNLPAGSNRWSLSYPGANFAAATVSMSGPGGPIAVQLEPIANGYGDNTLVFKPSGMSYAKPGADTDYTIMVSGITGSGVPSSIQYTVTVIDPASQFQLTVTPGAGGTVQRNPDQAGYAAGTVVTLTAMPDADYAFAGWSGDLVGNANPAQVTMSANRSVGATFSPILVPTATLPGGGSVSSGAASSVLVVPTVARTASFGTEVFVTNPSGSAVNVNLRYYGTRGTSGAGLNTCSAQAIPAQSTLALPIAAACPGLPAGSQFGMLVIEEALLTTPLTAFSRTANPQGSGFSVEAYPIGEFSPAPATVTGLKRLAAGPPPYQSNCFVGALGEPVDYRIVLTDGGSGLALGSPVTGSLQPWESVRYLDVFGPGGANAAAGDYSNVRADFSVTGSTRAALVGFCTVQDNLSFGADFRLAKSTDAYDDSQARTLYLGHPGNGVLSQPATLDDLTRKHLWLTLVRHPDALACTLAGPRSADLELRLREPGPLGSTPVRAGGNNQASFAVELGGRASLNAGLAGYWALEVGFREGGNPALPIDYGLTCTSGNGLSTPLLMNPVGFADDF